MSIFKGFKEKLGEMERLRICDFYKCILTLNCQDINLKVGDVCKYHPHRVLQTVLFCRKECYISIQNFS